MDEFMLQLVVQQAGLYKKELPCPAKIERWIRAALERDASFPLRFVDEAEGRELNARYRHKDYATNVLTFDYMHEPCAEADIIICVPVLQRQAREQNKTFEEHLAHLIVHGVLHAHGYDHLNEEEAEEMEARETEILTGLGFPNPYSDREGMVHD